ncbi:hypothetical protein SPONL_1419 [uncultured Candidatus Thioglobus sp.]|nr:hypothetical protein SPONL_1419 [uncultured Candidatus Thioglobus sp.]
MVCYCKKTIANHLVRASLRGSIKPKKSTAPMRLVHKPSFRGCSIPCGRSLCRCCEVMTKFLQVVYSTDGRPFHLPANTSCDTAGVIYLIFCTKCETCNTCTWENTEGCTTEPINFRDDQHADQRLTPWRAMTPHPKGKVRMLTQPLEAFLQGEKF